MSQSFSLEQIAQQINAELRGDGQAEITGIAPLQSAKPGQISFLNNSRYRKFLESTQATAVIISSDDAADCPANALVAKDPYVAYAKAASLLAPKLTNPNGIHPSSVIGENCEIHPEASIGANCVIAANVKIGKASVISSGCVIGENSSLGESCYLWPNVTIYHGVTIANRVRIHSGTVIGSDGFGFAKDPDGKWLKVPQLGGVRIDDDVEIGASTTIDRGALEDTIIEEGVILDNQIQVGHNVKIGAYTAIAACTGISGSVTIGKNCMISGMVGFTGHFEVCDNVMITGMTVVSKAITKPGIYSSGTAIEPHHQWRKNAVRFRQLDSMAEKIRNLEKQMNRQEAKEKEYE